MRFVRFGITLQRLERKHLEFVREWRNSDWVRPYMRYQTIIQPGDQTRWFESLESRQDWYFIAQIDEAPFALFHVKSVDWTRRSGESGGFVGNPAFIGRPESAQATLALMDFAFLVLHLQSLEAQYNTRLEKIVRFNFQLGYQIFREETDGFVRACVTNNRYFKCAAAFRKAAVSLHGTSASLAPTEPWLVQFLERDGVTRSDFQLELT